MTDYGGLSIKDDDRVEKLRAECSPPKRNADKNLLLAYLELTPACNNRCPACVNESFVADFQTRVLKSSFHRTSLSHSSWAKILSRLPPTVTSVILSGGEPTLHPAFTSIIEELNKQNLDFAIFTNGRWQTPEKLIASLKASSQFQGFLISLHGASDSSHEAFTGISGSYEETVRNIRAAILAGLPVSISTVITKDNLVELEAIIGLSVALGAEDIYFNRYLSTPQRLANSGERIHLPTPSQLRSAIEQIESFRSKWSSRIHVGYGPCIPQCFVSSASEGCSAGEASFVVDPWGNIKPCLQTDLLCGNLLEQSFETIWESESLRQWRGLYDNGCSSCSAFAQCGGGCRAMTLAWGQGRDPLMTEPLRESHQAITDSIPLPVIQY